MELLKRNLQECFPRAKTDAPLCPMCGFAPGMRGAVSSKGSRGAKTCRERALITIQHQLLPRSAPFLGCTCQVLLKKTNVSVGRAQTDPFPQAPREA